MNKGSLSLWGFLAVIWERGWIIVLFTLISVLVSALVSYYALTPIYEAKVDVLISGTEKNSEEENIGLNTTIDESIKLVPTYQDIVLSPLILKYAQSELNTANNKNIIIKKEDVKIVTKNDSQVFSIIVYHEDPQIGKQIADALAKAFNHNIDSLMNLSQSNVKLLSDATVSQDPVKPNPILIMGITFITSLIVSVWITLLIHNVKRIRTSV
ncbi:Wzz/FepE/Etk N-terminal domain-containing protein [Fictibacillus sp. b24]|uniref:YveK family protein n=1 Tax=Fictibacillus sp. b24 TaxID=3055863 RepID=UPI00259FEB08|nr:Wzz/FepE/Etk N-terminal domain-containing protein [Fictibacillus sp. b24]MDM5316420.1 Wzz/FepE/Etk N-terminal domain-containing protein [Fictibacillus sp. b24]